VETSSPATIPAGAAEQAAAQGRRTTIAFRVNAERIVLAGWSRAILLQLAHPLVAAGVAGHSSFRDSPVASARRLHQTVRAMLGLSFGTESERARVIGEIRGIHRRVNGRLSQPVGVFPAGTKYSAEDPDLLLWVHATLLDSVVLVYGDLVAGVSPEDCDAYCRDAASVAIALGARPAEVPRDWVSLSRYMERMYASGVLSVGPDARTVANAMLEGRLSSLAGPVSWANRRLTAGWLPPDIRQAYGFRWGAREDRSFRALVRTLRQLRQGLPRAIAWWPEARQRAKEGEPSNPRTFEPSNPT
jgi:uncharacterized protein (DUF2236 family)